MDCSYKSFSDNGKALKALIFEYENLLIKEKYLADSSGKSYREILQKISNGNLFDKTPSKFFSVELKKIEKPNLEKLQTCQEIIAKDSSFYNLSKLKGLEQVIINAQNSRDLQPSHIARDILKVLTEEDFELEFYKMRTFFLFSIVDTNSGLSQMLKELPKEEKKYDLSKALNVYINGNNQIFVDEEKIDIDKLKNIIKDYEKKYESESIISLKTERETMYKTYFNVQNIITTEINKLQSQLSKEKYKKELENLTKEELSDIRKIYPIRVIY